MTAQDRLDELTTERDRRFQERETDRAEQINGTDYQPVEINPWVEQPGNIVSNGQIPPGMPVVEVKGSEGEQTIKGPDSPRPRPRPQPKKPYLDTNKPVVLGYLGYEDYTSSKKLVSACWTPPGYVAVGFTVERETGQPVDYTCPRYEFHWLEDGDGECRPTPDPSAPYATMSACRNDPNNRIWLDENDNPTGRSSRDGPPPDELKYPAYSLYVGTSILAHFGREEQKPIPIIIGEIQPINQQGQPTGQWRLSAPSFYSPESWAASIQEGYYNHREYARTYSIPCNKYVSSSYYQNGSWNIPEGTRIRVTFPVYYQLIFRAAGQPEFNYGSIFVRSEKATLEWVCTAAFCTWSFPGDSRDTPPLREPPPPPRQDKPKYKLPESGKATTVERQFWISEPNEQDPDTYKSPYKILGINAEEESEVSLAYWRTSQGFVKHGRHIKSDETEEWCESTQFGDNSPTPWNEGVGKSLQLNPPVSLNRSACARQFSGSLTHNVLDSTLGKVIEIDPQQPVISITSTPTTSINRPLDQELDIVVADARMSDPKVRNIAVKIKVYDILPGSGCSLSAPVEKDAIVNRFMLQSIASTTTVIAPGYPIEDVPKAYSPVYSSSATPTGGATTARRYWYYWRNSSGEETRVEIPVEILRTDPVKAYLTQTGDRTAIAVLKIGEKTESGQVKACRVVRATIDLESSSLIETEDFSIDTTDIESIDDDWQTDYTKDRLKTPPIPAAPIGTMVQWNIDNEQRGNLRIDDSQAITLEGTQDDWVLGQGLKVKVWAISDFPSGAAEEIESNFAPIVETVSIVAASAVLSTTD